MGWGPIHSVKVAWSGNGYVRVRPNGCPKLTFPCAPLVSSATMPDYVPKDHVFHRPDPTEWEGFLHWEGCFTSSQCEPILKDFEEYDPHYYPHSPIPRLSRARRDNADGLPRL